MARRRLQIETLEERLPLTVDVSPALPTSGLIRFVSDGSLLIETESESQQIQTHWPDADTTSDWNPLLSGDFSGDGITDIYGETIQGEAFVLVNDGTQLFHLPWGSEPRPRDAQFVGVGDVTGDGLSDIVSFSESSSELWVSVNDLTQGFQLEQWATWPNQLSTSLTVADLDQDGRADVVGGGDGVWSIARSNGHSFVIEPSGPFPIFDWKDVLWGQFNADDHLDAVARAPDNTWWLWAGGDTGFAPAQYWGHWKMASNWHNVQVADFNADGLDDVIGRTEEGGLWVATSTSTGFHTWRWVTGWVHGANWQLIEIADITGDGLPDQVGQASDGTWWLAKNIEGNFRNEFLGRDPKDVAFVAPVDNFTSELESDIFQNRPIPNGSTEPKESEPLRVTLNEENELVIIGSGQRVRAIEFQSANGSLVPADGTTDVQFENLDSNLSTKIRLSTAEPIVVDGELRTGVKWSIRSASPDLVVHYDVVEVQAIVDARLFSNRPTLEGNDNLEKYTDLFDLPKNTEPSEVEEQQPPIESDATPAISLSLNDDDSFELDAFDVGVHVLRIESPSDSLIPGVSPAPFTELLASDPGLVVYAAAEPVTSEEPVVLDLGWVSSNPTDQLIAEYTVDDTKWKPAALFGARISRSGTRNHVPPQEVSDQPLVVSLSSENKLALTAEDLAVAAINIKSPSGSLVPGSNPKPFGFYLSNHEHQVTLVNWGTLVVIDGSITLDVGLDTRDQDWKLVVEYGSLDASVLVAEIDIAL